MFISLNSQLKKYRNKIKQIKKIKIIDVITAKEK